MHQVIAIDQDFLEVIPALADAAVLIPERLDLSNVLALEEICCRRREHIEDLTWMIINGIHREKHSG